MLICILYDGPNDDSASFFDAIFDYVEQWNISKCIITGDFNVTLNHELDNYKYAQPRNNRARNQLNEHIDNNGFTDAFRHLNQKKKMYTVYMD